MERQQTGLSVLVVDDDTELRDGLCDVLTEEGFKVDSATDGADALVHLRKRALPDVVLLDMAMPNMDGYEFLARRDGDKKLRDVPVVVISATADPRRLRRHAAAVLSKPVDLTALLAILGVTIAHA